MPSAEAECTEETQLLKKLVKDNIWKQDGKKVENLVNYKVVNMSLRLTEKVNVTLFLCTP